MKDVFVRVTYTIETGESILRVMRNEKYELIDLDLFWDFAIQACVMSPSNDRSVSQISWRFLFLKLLGTCRYRFRSEHALLCLGVALIRSRGGPSYYIQTCTTTGSLLKPVDYNHFATASHHGIYTSKTTSKWKPRIE
jgi:hypothetical protein